MSLRLELEVLKARVPGRNQECRSISRPVLERSIFCGDVKVMLDDVRR